MERYMNVKNVIRTLSAALLTLVATVAYAQNDALSAKIPFAFRAVGTDLPAGRYTISHATGPSGGSSTIEVRNMDTGKSVFIPSKAPIAASKDTRSRLVFRCADPDGCSLTSLWRGESGGMEFATPALTASQRERRETIYLERFKGK
jgi:hypothetical protein